MNEEVLDGLIRLDLVQVTNYGDEKIVFVRSRLGFLAMAKWLLKYIKLKHDRKQAVPLYGVP